MATKKGVGIEIDHAVLNYCQAMSETAVKNGWIGEGNKRLGRLHNAIFNGEHPHERWQSLMDVADQADPASATITSGAKAFMMESKEKALPIHLLFIRDSLDEAKVQAVKRKLDEEGFFTAVENMGLSMNSECLHFVEEKSLAAKLENLGLDTFLTGRVRTTVLPKDLQILGFGCNLAAGKPIPKTDNWSEIANYFTWRTCLPSQLTSPLTAIESIKLGIDNSLYKLTFENGKAYVLKHYHEDAEEHNERKKTEVKHLNILHELQITNVPKPVGDCDSYALFDFVEGRPVESPTSDHINQVIDILAELNHKREALKAKTETMVPGKAMCIRDYIDRINKRWRNLDRANKGSGGSQDVMFFMITDLEQLRQDSFNHCYTYCKRENLDLDQPFSENEMFFGTTDFGFHNALCRDNGQLVFFDFESSGWMDGAKFMADFFFNIHHQIDSDERLRVLEAFVKQRSWDPDMYKRFVAIGDMVYLEGIISVLEVVDPEVMRHLQFAKPDLETAKVVAEHLEKAQQLRKAFVSTEHICHIDQTIEDEGELG